MKFLSEFDVERSKVALWFAAYCLFATLLFVAWKFVGTVALSLFVYYVTRPVFKRINHRIQNRTLAAAVAIFSVALPILLLAGWTLGVVVQELTALARQAAFTQAVARLEPYLDISQLRQQFESVFFVILSDPSQLRTLELTRADGLVDVFAGSLAFLANVGLHLFIVLVITFYLLRDGPAIAAWARGTFLTEESVLDTYFVAVDRDLKSIYFGNILNAFVTGLLGATVYSLLNLVAPEAVPIPRPILLGLLTGAASLVPLIGMKLVWVPITLLLFVDSLLTDPETIWFPVLFALVSVVVVDYIPDQILRPYVSGRTLHVGAVMLAYIFGPILFGWYGIFLGPLIMVVVFEFARHVFPWLVTSEFGREQVTGSTETHDSPEPEGQTETTHTVGDSTVMRGSESDTTDVP